MKSTFRKTCMMVIFLSIMIPSSVIAQDHMAVSPSEWDFGDVEIGSSSTQIFTITNENGADLYISTIQLENKTSESFFITSAVPPPPIIIDIGNSYDINVLFSPISLGAHSVDLHILSNAADGDATIPIGGMGVPDEDPPSELMKELIDTFNFLVDEELIYGIGPGSSMYGRLKAFGNMLNATSDLINAGEYELACDQLQDSLNRVDGNDPPPDFVAGATEELTTMIEEVLTELGCT